MKKYFLVQVILFSVATSFAQRGDELLVYSVKGKVTAVYNNEESVVKIGRVLKPGMLLKTDRDAKLTMICRQGKALCVTQPGTYPLSKWKDSCRSEKGSITSNYLQYVWSELYHRSKEYKEELEKYGHMGITRGDPYGRFDDYPEGMVVVEFPRRLDTINYATGNFPLSWMCYDFNGNYQFQLYTAKERKLVFKDSTKGDYLHIRQFSDKLNPGTRYAWTVAAKANTGVIRRRILNCVAAETVNKMINDLITTVDFEEDIAAQSFRIAYMLEKKHFFAEAYEYYQKAAGAEPDAELYRSKLLAFRYEFRLDEIETKDKE